MRCDVDADSLASIFVLDKELEPVPEPFRLQPDVLFVVSFEHYRKFVKNIPESRNILHYATSVLHQRMEEGNETALLKAFYTDMALAVCKELHYAEEYRAGASCIRHAFPTLLAEKRIHVTGEIPAILSMLAQKKGFPLPGTFRNQNQKHWDYACRLLQDASSHPTKWSVEDIIADI